jgi:hypothetical protein
MHGRIKATDLILQGEGNTCKKAVVCLNTRQDCHSLEYVVRGYCRPW